MGKNTVLITGSPEEESAIISSYWTVATPGSQESVATKSNLILTKNDLSPLTKGIKLSRIMYQSIQSMACLELTYVSTLLVTNGVSIIMHSQPYVCAVQIF